MSMWTHINGIIEVEPMGRTQAEMTYILDTVLSHLPLVTGSERNMNIQVLQKPAYCRSSNFDEFGNRTNNLIDNFGRADRHNGWRREQETYFVIVSGDFRDRYFNETLREFVEWLCRLAKRVRIEDVMVEIRGFGKEILIQIMEEFSAICLFFQVTSKREQAIGVNI